MEFEKGQLSCLIYIKFLLLLATRNVRVQVKIVANATLSLPPYSTWAVQYFRTAQLYFSELVNSFDIFAISEHCLFEEQLEILEASINYTYKSTAVSAEDNPSILSGKAAHGGVALFWKNCINDMVTPLENIDSDRIVGIRCDFNDNSLLFILSVYLPAASHPIEEFNEYLDYLWALYDSLSK